MFKIDSPGATSDNKFTEGNAISGVEATVVSAEWLNAVQGELVNLIQAAGITLSKQDSAQLLAAVRTVALAIVTAQFTGANQNLAVNGAQNFLGGLKLRWGTFLGQSQVATPVTFALAFPEALYGVVITPNDPDLTLGYRVSATDGKLTGFSGISTKGQATSMSYIALGK